MSQSFWEYKLKQMESKANKPKKLYKIIFHGYYDMPDIESNSEKQIIRMYKKYKKYNVALRKFNGEYYDVAYLERGYYAKDDRIV
jgi:hypothetical protein